MGAVKNIDRFYRCPACQSDLMRLGSNLECVNGHRYPVANDSSLVRFAATLNAPSDYAVERAAEVHDRALEWLLNAHHVSERQFRLDVLSPLKLSPGMRVLVTGVGAGNDLNFIADQISPGGVIYALDVAEQMILAAIQRVGCFAGASKVPVNYCLSDAVNLPFHSNAFDAVYHFGGINLFSNIASGVSEMSRVGSESARVVFGDEGLGHWLRDTEIGKVLLANNPLYQYLPPLHLLPPTVSDVSLSWVINNCYYLVGFTNTKSPLKIDLDLRHEGSRGGSLRTRFYGTLEGIDPELKREVYDFAIAEGSSRVDMLERVIREGLKKLGCRLK
jgi:SAM-dependent methyltransferase